MVNRYPNIYERMWIERGLFYIEHYYSLKH
jgi:hypothetical protein